MGISPPSDLVLDVVRAADPANVREARETLSRIARSRAPSGDAFSFAAGGPAAAGSPVIARIGGDEAMLTRRANNAALYGAGAALAPGRDRAGVLEAFEAVTLTTFVQALMPKDAAGVYGSGPAGEIWRSMLAEKIAAEVAAAGGLGIAAELERSLGADGAGPAGTEG